MKFQHYLDYFKNSTVNYLDGFDGEPDSYEFALYLSHRVAYVHKGVTAAEVVKLASMAAQMAEYIIDFEADFKKTIADICAPDEKHCSCVPHLRRAYHELSSQVVQKSNEPGWSSEIPTAPGHYWFHGTTAYERKNYSPMKPLTKMVFRDEDGFYCNGDYVDPEEHNWIGKWLKFTPPTPEVDNENG